MEEPFAQYHGYTKYFNISLGPDGELNPQELERMAGERKLIKLQAA